MRFVLRGVRWLGLSILLAPAPASAQGLFETLFGGGSGGPPQHMRSVPQQVPQPPPVPPTFGYRTPYYNPYRQSLPQKDEHQVLQSRSGAYRTLCVRMCDGYYWPISHGVSRSAFYRDANACRASCGEDARLFYHSSADGDVRGMVDLQGRPYARLPIAFKYRKAQVEGCKCKPEPWARSELDRHRLYALNESTEDRQRRLDRFAGIMIQTGGLGGGDLMALDRAVEGGGLAARAVAAASHADGAVQIAEASPASPGDERVPSTAPEIDPGDGARTKARRGDLKPDARQGNPAHATTPRPQVHRASLARSQQPAGHQPKPGPFGGAFSGGSKLRWPGD